MNHDLSDPLDTDAVTVLEGMYAAEAQYLAVGGPGKASFQPLASFFAPDVVLHQAEALPYGGNWRGHQGMEHKRGTSSRWSNRPTWRPRAQSWC